MNDFETHPRGTARELQHLRTIAREIEQINEQYRGVVPNNVMLAYHKLMEFYNLQKEQGYYYE